MALTQIATTDSVSASVVNTKIVDPANTALAGLQIAQTAGGTATAITLTGVELTNGYQKTFIISASNSGSATTVNGKPLYKPGGTVAPNLVSGKSASIWYSLAGDCFFYKASAEGTAAAGDVLAGETFSNDDDTGVVGTMTNRGAVTITPGTSNQAIAAGYHNGSGYVAGDADLVAGNIVPSVNIFGVVGNAPVKKWATGNGISTGTNLASVSGFHFALDPSIIVIAWSFNGYSYRKVYNSLGSALNNYGYSNNGYVEDLGAWTVYSAGFATKISGASIPYSWIAYE